MKAGRIIFGHNFVKKLDDLPSHIGGKVEKLLYLLRKDPLHPSLRLHKLTGKWDGYWSISIDLRYRIIFRKLENGDMIFVSVGTHAIYK